MKMNQTALVSCCTLVAAVWSLPAATLTGKVSAGKGASVVYLEAIAGKTFPVPAKAVQLNQKALLFQPHVVVAPVGSTVEFLNNDNVAHNIFWPSVGGNKKLSHNLGTAPTGQARSFKFDTPGVVPLLCNVHPEMSAYVIVIPTPFYAITDELGSYKLPDLPDGHYSVSVWHEGMKIQTKPIFVTGNSTLDFGLSK